MPLAFGMLRRSLLLAGTTFVAACATADRNPLRALTTGAYKPVLQDLAGPGVTITNDTAGAVARRIEQGEAFDLVVLTPALLAPLAQRGLVRPDSVTPLARVGIGVAVPAGAPLPQIGTAEDFRRTVLAARKVAYIDPSSGGSSGIYLQQLFERLGIAPQVAARAVLVPGGLVAERLVTGEADLAIHQVSEILAVPRAQLVGPLPASLQNYTTYVGAVKAGGPREAEARALLRRLVSSEAAEVLRRRGMLPAS